MRFISPQKGAFIIKIYQFTVTSQCIKEPCGAAFVAGSAEIYEAVFTFDASWDGFARTTVFECAGERREQLLVNDRCIVPWEILHAGAYLRVGVYGVSGSATMPTVYSGTMFVARGAEPSEAAREHSPDVFDQIVEIGQQAAEAKQQWENMSAEAETLPAGTPATASYEGGVLSLGIPSGGGGTGDHTQLTNRDAAAQHPMSAITGLEAALSGKQPSGDYATNTTVGAVATRVTAIEGKESGWDGKYSKPSGGIPKTDLASAVQTSLGLADSALQEHLLYKCDYGITPYADVVAAINNGKIPYVVFSNHFFVYGKSQDNEVSFTVAVGVYAYRMSVKASGWSYSENIYATTNDLTAYRTASAQDVIDATKISDAPSDGEFYVRKNGAWVALGTMTGGSY